MHQTELGGKLRGLSLTALTFRSLKMIFAGCRGLAPLLAPIVILSLVAAPALYARQKEDQGFGFSVEVPASESELLQAVQEVVEDGIIQGSKEYNKDQYIENAAAATSSTLFPKWTDPGSVFYKVRDKVLAPLNFKEANDEGTVAVRYVVRGEGPSNTILRIDAVYVEDFRRTVHPSNGTVESAEYKAIQDHLDALELKTKQATETEQQHQEDLAKQVLDSARNSDDAASRLLAARTSSQTLEQHVQDLRRQAERVVKAPGAQLKSAPFHTATTLKTLSPGTDVVLLILTPYWYGVETEDGQHGWLFRDQLESLP